MAKRIVFWGDSITDSMREQKHETDMTGYHRAQGCGYVRMIAGALGYDQPEEYEVINRGISGNRIVDLYARIKSDLINLKPDVISILVGINGIWHELWTQNGVDAAKYEMVYDLIIQEIRQALPDVKIMILEPFVLHGTATMNTEEIPDRWAIFQAETKLRQEAAKRIAQKYDLLFVPLQDAFNEANTKTQREDYWLGDGVHPNAPGHELIKRQWLKAFKNL